MRGLLNKTVEFYSTNFQLGQEETPQSPPRATVSYGRIITDYAGRRQVTTQEVRTITGVVNRLRRVVTGGIGMTETNGNPAVDPPGAVAAAERAMSLQPERYLLTALDNPSGLSALTARTFRGETMSGVRYAIGADTMNLWFDRPTGLLVVSESARRRRRAGRPADPHLVHPVAGRGGRGAASPPVRHRGQRPHPLPQHRGYHRRQPGARHDPDGDSRFAGRSARSGDRRRRRSSP